MCMVSLEYTHYTLPRHAERLAQRGIVADAPDLTVQIIVRQSEAAEEAEGEVAHLSQLKSRDSVERAEHERRSEIRAQTAREQARAAIAVAIVEPDQRVILQVVYDGHGRHRRLPA